MKKMQGNYERPSMYIMQAGNIGMISASHLSIVVSTLTLNVSWMNSRMVKTEKFYPSAACPSPHLGPSTVELRLSELISEKFGSDNGKFG
jgi:hypothetical protein